MGVSCWTQETPDPADRRWARGEDNAPAGGGRPITAGSTPGNHDEPPTIYIRLAMLMMVPTGRWRNTARNVAPATIESREGFGPGATAGRPVRCPEGRAARPVRTGRARSGHPRADSRAAREEGPAAEKNAGEHCRDADSHIGGSAVPVAGARPRAGAADQDEQRPRAERAVPAMPVDQALWWFGAVASGRGSSWWCLSGSSRAETDPHRTR